MALGLHEASHDPQSTEELLVLTRRTGDKKKTGAQRWFPVKGPILGFVPTNSLRSNVLWSPLNGMLGSFHHALRSGTGNMSRNVFKVRSSGSEGGGVSLTRTSIASSEIGETISRLLALGHQTPEQRSPRARGSEANNLEPRIRNLRLFFFLSVLLFFELYVLHCGF